MLPTLALPLFASFVAALLLTPLVRRFALASQLVANPVADRWHKQPTPLLGGIAVYGGFLVGGAFALRKIFEDLSRGLPMSDRTIVGIIVAASLMFLIGLVDDRVKLRPATKLIGQALAASIVISAGVVYPVTPWIVVNVLVTVFWFIGVTNALNLLDNMDGVAAGVAAIASIFLGITFALDGVPGLAAACFALAGALLGFLPYNFRPASIFMGDSGSLFIGSLLASLGAAYPTRASASIVSVLFVPGLIVVIPIIDTLTVTIARTLAGRPISQGGRDHTAHRLVALGLSQRQVALLLYAFAIGGGILALVLRQTPPELGMPLGALFLVGLFIGAAFLGRLHKYELSQPMGTVSVLVTNLFHKRRAFEVLLDIMLFAIAYQFAYLLRWDADIPLQQATIFEQTIAIAVIAKSLSFGVFGVYRGHWDQLSVPDIPRIVGATAVGALVTLASLVMLYPSGGFSRSIFFIDGILVMLFTIGARVAFHSLEGFRASAGAPALVYGAGSDGAIAIREMLSNPALSLRPIGFVDDDPAKRGRIVHGYPVVGSFKDVPDLIRRRGIAVIVVGSRQFDATAIARLGELCDGLNVHVLQLHIEFQTLTPATGIATLPDFGNARLFH